MKNFFYLTFLISLIMFSCKRDTPCSTTCGSENLCECTCTCPEGSFKINDVCKLKQNGEYAGSLSCGCLSEFIIGIWPGDQEFYHITYSVGSGSGNMNYLGDDKYQFYLPKECDFDNGHADHVNFNVEIVPEGLQVDAQWIELNTGEVFETCSSLFLP